MSKRLNPKPNQPHHDLVFTPRALAAHIVNHFAPRGKVLDPCKGEGAFYDQFPDTCEKYWCEIEMGVDFFAFSEPVHWIITNPPWSKARQFLLHSYCLTDNIVFLITINHLMTKARLREMERNSFGIREFLGIPTPKAPWPQSGFQLAACHLQRGYGGPTIWNGKFGV